MDNDNKTEISSKKAKKRPKKESEKISIHSKAAQPMRVVLRPNSARSRFIFSMPTPPSKLIKKDRHGVPPKSPHRTISNIASRKEEEKRSSDRKYNNDDEDSDKDNDNKERQHVKKSFIPYENRGVRLWKWNHIQGATDMANFKSYSPRQKKQSKQPEQPEQPQTQAVSFFNLIRIHEAECPAAECTPIQILLASGNSNNALNHPPLPPLSHPPHDTMPPSLRPISRPTPSSSTTYVPIFKQIMQLTAKEIAPKIPPFSLKSLVYAQMLMPKFPMVSKIFKTLKRFEKHC